MHTPLVCSPIILPNEPTTEFLFSIALTSHLAEFDKNITYLRDLKEKEEDRFQVVRDEHEHGEC